MTSSSSTAPQSQTRITYAFHGLVPPFASASTSAISLSPLQKLPCDVLLNHRGSDVKHLLSRAIYNPLHSIGLRVFLDSEDLPLGDFFPTELQEAMTSASLSVALFSPLYAQSPCCLAELSFMLKSGTTISPVFYRVQHNDARHLVHEKGIDAGDLLKHQKKGRYSTDKLEEWKMALHKSPFCKGESINNNGQEQRVLTNSVNRVLKVMKRVPLAVAKHHVGLEEALVGFEMTAGESAKAYPNVQNVVICGMGGLGKIMVTKKLSDV